MKPTTSTRTSNAPIKAGKFARFRRDEDGGMIVFSLFMFVLIMWFGGMAVDFMRFETTRATLQATSDRAALASADLDQVLPPEEVCEDYFAKAGMSKFLDSCTVDQGLNFRVVTVQASVEMPLFFYDLARVLYRPFSSEYSPGLSTLTVSASSSAEERVTDVEVSLVLDVSGSMGSNSRIQNLRPAARDFVTTVLANNTDTLQGLLTISMVPYSAVVNVGPDIAPHLNIVRTHDYSTCPLFDTPLFAQTALNLDTPYRHVSHFDPNWLSGASNNNPIAYPWCPVGDHNSVLVASTSEADLHSAINDLAPYGNTAIDMGMRWGVGLLDPSTRSIITALAGQDGSGVPAIAAGRPQNFDQSDILKVVVLMTDGQNTTQYDLVEPYKSGQSFVWFDLISDTEPLADAYRRGQWSVQTDGQRTPTDYTDDRFFWNGDDTNSPSRTYPSGFADQNDYQTQRGRDDGIALEFGQGLTYANSVRQASWQDIFATFTYNSVNNSLLRSALDNNALPWSSSDPRDADYVDSDGSLRTNIVNSSQADRRLSDLCTAARARGIIIYTVAFEAPSRGRAALEGCASSPSHYFDVAGTDVSAAFSAIASDIRALKLTR